MCRRRAQSNHCWCCCWSGACSSARLSPSGPRLSRLATWLTGTPGPGPRGRPTRVGEGPGNCHGGPEMAGSRGTWNARTKQRWPVNGALMAINSSAPAHHSPTPARACCVRKSVGRNASQSLRAKALLRWSEIKTPSRERYPPLTCLRVHHRIRAERNRQFRVEGTERCGSCSWTGAFSCWSASGGGLMDAEALGSQPH